MAVTDSVQIEGASAAQDQLRQIAQAIVGVTGAQERQTTAQKAQTAAERKAAAVARQRRRQRQQALRQQREQEQQVRALAQAVVGYGTASAAIVGIAGRVASALGGALRSAITAVTGDFTDSVNTLAKLGLAFGTTAGEVSRLEYQFGILTRGGVDASKVLTAVADAVGRAEEAGSRQGEIFASLGVSVRDAAGELRSAPDVFADLQGALAGLSNDAERAAVATQLFGRRQAADLLPALMASTAEMQALASEHATLAGDMHAAAAAAQEQADAYTRMETAVAGLRNEIGTALSPVIVGLTNHFAELAAELRASLEITLRGGKMSEVAAAITDLASAEAEVARLQSARADMTARLAEEEAALADAGIFARIGRSQEIQQARTRIEQMGAELDYARELAEQYREGAAPVAAGGGGAPVDVAGQSEARRQAAEAARQQAAEEARLAQQTAQLGLTRDQMAERRYFQGIQLLQQAREAGLVNQQEHAERVGQLREQLAAEHSVGQARVEAEQRISETLATIGVKEEDMHAARLQRMRELLQEALDAGRISTEEFNARLAIVREQMKDGTEDERISTEEAGMAAVGATAQMMNSVGDLSDSISSLQGKTKSNIGATIKSVASLVTTILGSISAISTASTASTATNTATMTGSLATIAVAAAPAATLTSIATIGGAVVGAVAGIIGAIASISSIAKASRGFNPGFLSQFPALDAAGHRPALVKPDEAVVDSRSTASMGRMFDAVSSFFAAQQAPMGGGGDGGGDLFVSVEIGGQQMEGPVTRAVQGADRVSYGNSAFAAA